MAPQPAQGAQICWCDHQLGTCRLQSLNKAVLTQSEPSLLLLHTQSFSQQHPASCSCAGAHSNIPNPLLMGQRALHLAHPLLVIRRKSLQITITSPSYTRNVAHQRGHLQETTLSSHPAASLCRQGSDVQGKTHISQAFSVLLQSSYGRTKSFGNYCSCKLTSQALECQSPSTSPAHPRCDMTVAQQCSSTVTGTNNLLPSSCLEKSWRAS